MCRQSELGKIFRLGENSSNMNDEDGTPVISSSPKKDCQVIYVLLEKDKECYGKLISVLMKVLQPNFKTSDDTVLTKLFDFIVNRGSESSTHRDILTQIICEWLKRICKSWPTLPEESKVLAVKMAGYVASSPAGYSKFASTGSLTFLLSDLQSSHKNSNAIELGFIHLLESLISNEEGSRIILDSGVWKNVVNTALTSTSKYCLRQSTKLLASMLMIADMKTSEIIFQELIKICASSQPSSLSEEQPNPPQDSSTKEVQFVNALSACRAVILCLMEKGHPVNRINSLIKSCDITRWTWELIKNEKRKRVFQAANKLMCVINSLLFYQCKDKEGLIPFDTSKHVMDVLLGHLSVLTRLKHFYELVDGCVDYQVYLLKFGATVAPEKEVDSQGKMITEVPFCIHNLLLLLHATPLFMCMKLRGQSLMFDTQNEYIEKLFNISNCDCVRNLYGYRDALITYGEEICILSIYVLKRFMETCSILKKEQAVLVFQATVYLLGEFLVRAEESVDVVLSCRTFTIEGDEFIAKYPSLLSAALNCLHCYMSKFEFSWRDSLESLDLLSLLQKLLDSKSITRQITVEALRVIDIVLQKFMPPNLALLADTIKDSSIEDLGAQLFELLHHEDWAVRDSALEIVRTISSLSRSRFPAFQTLLLECRLPEVVMSIIETDPESFVRATALSCLLELVKVGNVWKVTLLNKNVVGKLLLTLTNETEGIVRVAAAKCITVMHSWRMLSSNDLELVYDVMSHTARNDLHWEVKVECLSFWRSVLCRSVVDQGMMDGDFPEFVFSKEHKKIIKLTPNEIALRLSRSLTMLGDIGCLQVLFDTFSNDPDLAVQRKASSLLKDVIYFLRRWRVDTYEESKKSKCSVVADSPSDEDLNEWEFTCCESMDFSFWNKASEEIIEEIISQTDAELLKGIANIGLEVRKTLPPIERFVMSDKEFVRRIRGLNVDKVLEAREKWVCNASQETTSLLDDILLFSREEKTLNGYADRNAVDCY